MECKTRRRHPLVVALCCLGLAVAFVQTSSGTLLLRYTFDEPSGDALDTGAAPAADGAFMNNATRTTNTPAGFSAAALDLISTPGAGAGNYVTAGDVAKLDSLSAFTLTTWLNLQTDTGGNRRLLAKQNAGTWEGFSWNLADPNEGARSAANFTMWLFVGAEKGFVHAKCTEDIGADNEWKFLAVTYDGTETADNLKYYVGGVNTPVTQLGASLTADGGATLASGAAFALGFTSAAPTSNTSPPAFMDDARVYGSALDLASLEQVRLENVPEPATAALLGLAGVLMMRRRRKI